MTQKQHNQELPEKRRWDPVFVRRLWVTIAVVVVALSAGLAIYFENNRAAEAAKKADEKGEFIIQTPDTVESIIEKGSVDEMLQFGQTQALVNRNQEFILVYEQMQDRVKLYQELERRSGDLDDRKQQLIKQQLLSSQFDLLIACHEEGLVDAELESNAKATANRLIEDKNNEISRQAHMAVSTMHLMSAFAKDRESDEIDIAYKSVGSLLKRYPDDAKVVDMTFFLLRTLGSEERDIEVTDEFYNLLIQHCANSKRENIRLSGHGFRGRQLLLKHEIIDVKGVATIRNEKELGDFRKRFDNFIAEDFVISPSIAQSILEMANGLATLGSRDDAKHISESALNRIGKTEHFTDSRREFQELIYRLNLTDQIVDLPHHTKTEFAVVLYVKNNADSVKAMSVMHDLQTISPTRKFECIFVTGERETDKLQQYSSDSNWEEISFVQDSKRESVYFQMYPGNVFPYMIILEPTGKVIGVGANVGFLKELKQRLKNNS